MPVVLRQHHRLHQLLRRDRRPGRQRQRQGSYVGAFHPGPPHPNDSRVPGAAYTQTVANRATVNTVITGFVIVLYNQGGAEIGQSTATFPGAVHYPWTAMDMG